MDDSLNKRINYEYPYFEDYVEPKGALKLERESHACFYFMMLAWKARGNAGAIENQIIEYKVGEEIPLWREDRKEEIARSVATIYALESPDAFLKYKKEAWYQAKLLGLNVPADIFDLTPRIIN